MPNPPHGAAAGRRSCCSSALSQAVRSWCSKHRSLLPGSSATQQVLRMGFVHRSGRIGAFGRYAITGGPPTSAARERCVPKPIFSQEAIDLVDHAKNNTTPAGNRSRKREGGRLSKPGALHHRLHAAAKRSALRTRRLKRYPMPRRAGDVAPLCRRTSLHRRADDKPTKSTSRRNSSVLCGRRIPHAENQWRN